MAETAGEAADKLTPLHWIGIGAALVTAGVHFFLGAQDLTGLFGISFIFAGIGFLGGVAAVIVGWRRRLVYALGIPFTAGQVVLWFVLNQPIPPVSAPEAVDKLAQVVLIVVLVVLLYRSRE